MATTSTRIGGRYELEAPLGRGGMGAVYRARHLALDSYVAVKLLRRSVAADQALRQRFLTEARVTAQLKTRYAVRVFDFGVSDDGEPFLVMELLEGETLAQRLRRAAPLAAETTATFLAQAARALESAHALRIVHRDFKPENLFIVREDGREIVKVVDFGIAKLVGDQERSVDLSEEEGASAAITRAGTRVGTPSYMAPEQVNGSPALGPAADIWAFGVVAFECVTGRRPFAAQDTAGLFAAIRAGDHPPARALRRTLPEAFDAWFDRACAPDPARRFGSPTEAARALAAALETATPDALADDDASPALPPEHGPQAGTALDTALDASLQPAKTRGRNVGRPLLVALAIGALVVSGLVFRARTKAPALPATAPSAPGALAYAAGLQAWRDGSSASAVRYLERAAAADPSLAEAPLRLALWSDHRRRLGVPFDLVAARAHHQKAQVMRATLSDFDRALLDASEPRFRQMSDVGEWERRMADLAAANPRSGEAWHWLAAARFDKGDEPGARAALEHALEVDPALAPAVLATRAIVQGGDEALAGGAYDACLKANPRATDCLSGRAKLRARAHDCGGMESDAHDWVAADPDEDNAQIILASALYANGAPMAAVEEAVRAAIERTPADEQAYARRLLGYTLAMARADFGAAARYARELIDAVGPGPGVEKHFAPSMLLVWAALEAGDLAEVERVSNDLLGRARAWTPSSPREVALPLFFATSAHHWGHMSDAAYDAERRRWLELGERAYERTGTAKGPARYFLWMTAYAVNAYTPAGAKEAVDVLPKYGPLPSPIRADSASATVIGAFYAATGHDEEAVAYLSRAASVCDAFENGLYAVMRSKRALVPLYAKKGRLDEARREAKWVLDRWGAGTPRSVTAEEVREAVKALEH